MGGNAANGDWRGLMSLVRLFTISSESVLSEGSSSGGGNFSSGGDVSSG